MLVQPQHDKGEKPDKNSAEFREASDSLQDTLKNFRPLNLLELPPTIQQALSWMRAQKDDVVSKKAAVAPSPEMGHDLRLLRFLVGAKWDPEKAMESYIKVLSDRKKLNVDDLRNKMVSGNADFFEGKSDALKEVHFHPQSQKAMQLMPKLWVDPSKPGDYALLRDRQQHLVQCEYAPDFKRVEELGVDNYAATELAINELQVLVLDELSKRDGILRMVCRVQDTFNQEKALSSSLVPNPFAGSGEKGFKSIGETMKLLYPTVVFKWFMVNMGSSWIGSVRGAINNFGGRSAYKMIVCGTDFQATVHESVDPAQLPEQLGGALPKAYFAK